MSLRLPKSVVAVVLAGSTLLVPGAAGAATSPRPAAKPPWKSYRSAPFTDAAGKVCPFAVHAVPFDDHEQYRTLSTFANGSARLQEYRGPLHYRYTNERSGKTVSRNLSGYAYYQYGKGGATYSLFLEHGGTTVPIGDQGYPAGEWVFSGQFIVNDAHGEIHVHLLHAHAENMCKTLG